VRADKIAAALADSLDRRDALLTACDEVESSLGAPTSPSLAVAKMLAPWIGARAAA
jgi:hypothetical protein